MMSVEMPDAIAERTNGQLSTRDLDIRYGWIADYMELNGFAPSYREMARGWGVTPAAIKNSLDSMERRGWITFIPRVSRSIRLRRAAA